MYYLSNAIKKNLTATEIERVRTVANIAENAVEKNVNQFLVGRARLRVNKDYIFEVESAEMLKKSLRSSKFAYGYCDYREKKIVLHLDHILLSPIEEIVDTILHECSHAVAYHIYGDAGHGKDWRKVSRMFGNHPRATSKSGSEALNEKIKKEKKYKIVVFDYDNYEVEAIGGCSRRMKNMETRYKRGDLSTMGKLWLVRTEDFKRIGPNLNELERVAFR